MNTKSNGHIYHDGVYVGNQSFEPIGERPVAIVFGAGGFIGSHMATFLKNKGYWVRGIDLKLPEFSKTSCDDFILGDLREVKTVIEAFTEPYTHIKRIHSLYQFAADMGGAGYIFTGENDLDIMHNSAQINLNVIGACKELPELNRPIPDKIFYSSSACIYPSAIQNTVLTPFLKESDAYPADPDSEYGWEKLFSERLYLTLERNLGIPVRIARFHNIYGPEGTFQGGREKAPAAMCRKVIEVEEGGSIEVWGSGSQTRTFMFIDDCVERVWALMESDFSHPLNIGSDEVVTINELAQLAIQKSGKAITIKNIEGPTGVNGRASDNGHFYRIIGVLSWHSINLGMEKTFHWINEQINDKT